MAHTISLVCYNETFSVSGPIDPALLEKVVATRDDLRLEREESRCTLTIWTENASEWWPLLWISPDGACMNSNPILDHGLYYHLVDIAEAVNASIVTEEGYLFYIAGYGLLYDPEVKEDAELEVGELHQEIIKTDDLGLAIKNILANKERGLLNKTQPRSDGSKSIAKLESRQHYIAIAIFVVLITCMVIKKCG